MEPIEVNRRHADQVRAATIGSRAVTEPSLRAAALARSAGGPALPEPYDALARQVDEAAYRVTDAQVAAVRDVTGSDLGAFEIILSACVGAGLARWDAAVRVIEGSGDAAS